MLNTKAKTGFTLVEALVVTSTVAVLMAVFVPALSRARQHAESVVCQSNIRQIGFAFIMYSLDYNDYAMPNYDPQRENYWWGQKSSDGIDHTKGYVWPYLQSELKDKSVYECPAQKFGTYVLQGKPPTEPDAPKWITSTYGYNGYYLTPAASPWFNIHHRPWQRTTTVPSPGRVIAFADTMLDWDVSAESSKLSNIALVDPPHVLNPSGQYWVENPSPTTSFRHNGTANIFFVDGHVSGMEVLDGKYTSPDVKIGSISKTNAPYYVPDYQKWPITGRRRR